MPIEASPRALAPLAVLLLFFAAAVSGCVTAPYDHYGLGNPLAPFTVQGVAQNPSSAITVEALDQSTGAWTAVGSTASAATATFAAGTWKNSPALYSYTFNVTLANACFWTATCQLTAQPASAKIRVREGATDGRAAYHHGGRSTSLGCAYAKLKTGVDFLTAGSDCGFNDSVITIKAAASQPSSGPGALAIASPRG